MSQKVAIKEHGIPVELLKPPPRRAMRRAGTLGIGLIVGRLLFVPLAAGGLYVLALIPIKARVMFGELVSGRIEDKTSSAPSGRLTRIVNRSLDLLGNVRRTRY